MNRAQAHATFDVASGAAIVGLFGFSLYMATLPIEALLFAAIAVVFGAVWAAYGLSRLRSGGETGGN